MNKIHSQWKLINKATEWWSINQRINHLNNDLSRASSRYEEEIVWLNESEQVLKDIQKFEADYQKNLSGIKNLAVYLRFRFFWLTQDWLKFEREIDEAVHAQPNNNTFVIIKVFNCLRQLANEQVPSIAKIVITNHNKQTLIDQSMALMENIITQDKSIMAVAMWSKAWIYHKIGDAEKEKVSVVTAWELDGERLGNGWTLWAQWMGVILNPLESVTLLQHVIKSIED